MNPVDFGPERVMVVDDDDSVRRFMVRALERHGFKVDAFSRADEALGSFRPGAYALVLSDLRMPGHDGLWLLEHLVEVDDEVGVVMVTANLDLKSAVDCLTRGATNYILKPVDLGELLEVIARVRENRRLRIENRYYRQDLERLVRERTASLEKTMVALKDATSALETAYRESIYRLAAAAEYRDEETGNHILRVGWFSQLIAQGLGCPEEFISVIRLASPMHDVGKIGIRDSILLKPGRLTVEEFEEVKLHPLIGARILSGSDSPLLQMAESIALTHHEWYDGNGYPRRLAGDDIPLEGRIVALADAFDALTSERVYKPVYPLDEAQAIIGEETGSHFDPEVVSAFRGVLDQILEVRELYEVGEVPGQESSSPAILPWLRATQLL